MLFSVLKKLNFDGTLEIIDSNGKAHKFGNSNPHVCIRLKNKSIERKLFLNPNLHIGEAYMNEELVVEKGTIECGGYDNIVWTNSNLTEYVCNEG